MTEWVSSDKSIRLLTDDVMTAMRTLPDSSVDTIVSSPPYLGLRSYDHPDAWGLESDWRDYMKRMLEWGAECYRVLKPSGAFWLQLGDCYASSPSGHAGKAGLEGGQPHGKRFKRAGTGFRPKDLMLLPSRIAIALHDEMGFYVRNDVIWAKTNHMPSSVKDRFANGYEHLFLLTKQPRYYFNLDAVRRPQAPASKSRVNYAFRPTNPDYDSYGFTGEDCSATALNPNGANPGDVLHGPTAQFSAKALGFDDFDHFAVFPEYLAEFALSAGAPKQVCVTCGKPRAPIVETSQLDLNQRRGGTKPFGDEITRRSPSFENKTRAIHDVTGLTSCECGDRDGYAPGIVLDPFSGSGTTMAVAARLGLRGTGIDLSQRYNEMAQKRIEQAILEREHGKQAAREIEAGQMSLPL